MEGVKQIIEIPIEKIEEPTLPARSVVDEEKLQELTQSIAEVGQLNPIKVVKVGDKYRIIDGHMRYLAMKALGKNLIKAVVEKPKDSAEALAWRLHANIYVPTNPYNEAIFFKRVMEELNLTVSELAEKLHRSEAYVRSRLAILEYPEEIQQALMEEKMTLGVAKQLARVKNDAIRQELVRRAVMDGVSESRAKIWADQFSKVEEEAPPPPPQQIEEEIKQIEEYLPTPCEICGEKVKLEELATLSGHRKCIDMLLQAVEYERQLREKEEQKTEEEEKEGGVG